MINLVFGLLCLVDFLEMELEFYRVHLTFDSKFYRTVEMFENDGR